MSSWANTCPTAGLADCRIDAICRTATAEPLRTACPVGSDTPYSQAMVFPPDLHRSGQAPRPAVHAPPLSELAREIGDFLAGTSLTLVSCDGRDYLSIPKHHHFAWLHRGAQRRHALRRGDPARRFYEETTTLLVSYLIGRFRPSTFIDAGAARGYFSRVAASRIQDPPSVFAFEMRADWLHEFEASLAGDRFRRLVTPIRAGLTSQHAGEQQIWYSRSRLFEYEPRPCEYREAWWLRAKHALSGRSNRGLNIERVLLTSLDHFTLEHAIHPGLIKIDVEGYEGKVLDGAAATLRRDRPLVVLELHRDKAQRHGTTRRDVVRRLFDLGYGALFLTDHHNRRKCRVVEAGPASPYFCRQETDLVLFVPG